MIGALVGAVARVGSGALIKAGVRGAVSGAVRGAIDNQGSQPTVVVQQPTQNGDFAAGARSHQVY